MCIIFADDIGQINVDIDSSGIDFCGGYAYFTSASGKDYKIPITNIIAIKKLGVY